MTGLPRSAAARVGLTLINIWAPGLGLLRTGRLRTALLFLLLPSAAFLLLLAWAATRESFGFGEWAAVMIVFLAAEFAALIGSMVATWRQSRWRTETCPPWRRWYSMVAAAIALPLLMLLVSDACRARVHNFYIPSEAMMPTLVKNDRLVASMHGPGDLRRGDIILFRMPGENTYIKRVAALPGDRIAMRQAIVLLNGRPVPQRLLREDAVSEAFGVTRAKRLAERFPGEAQDHQIYEIGPSELDDMPERMVPPGFVFVLGDNRDRSADSRVPRAEMGVELLPIADIEGRTQFLTWPRSKMGRRLDGNRGD